LKSFPEKWRLLFRNRFQLFLKAFSKITRLFEDIFREIEAFSRIARLFKYIYSGIEAFLK
jgi:hypothetical protein